MVRLMLKETGCTEMTIQARTYTPRRARLPVAWLNETPFFGREPRGAIRSGDVQNYYSKTLRRQDRYVRPVRGTPRC